MLKNLADDLNCNVYLNAAEQLGYEVKVIDPKISYATISHHQQILKIYKNVLSVNDAVQRHFSVDKYLANNYLKAKFDQWFPQTLFFTNEDEDVISQIVEFSQQKQGQIVIKPNKKSLGTGVTVKPQDTQQIERAVDHIFEELNCEELIVQEFIPSDFEYRVLLYKGQFVDALKRIPAAVTGDGTKTIAQLVADKNTQRDEYGFDPIELDGTIKGNLAEQDMTVETVAAQDQTVVLRKTCNLSQGGEVYRVEPVQKYIDLFEQVAQATGLAYIGLDFMGPDITQEFKPQGAFNEINSAPMIDLHYFADLQQGKTLETTQKLLKMIF